MKYITSFLLSVLSIGTCVADGVVELQLRDEAAQVSTKVSSAHLFGTVQVSSTGYQQAYIGPKLTISPTLTVGVGVGLERTATESWSPRIGTFARIAYEKWSLFAVYEDGGATGPFVKVVGGRSMTPWLTIGLHYQSTIGMGPRVDITPAKNVTLWGAVLDGDTAVVGLKYSF